MIDEFAEQYLHQAYSNARYLGEVFNRPFPDTVPRWNAEGAWKNEHRATEDETREQIIALYRRVAEHTDATINTLSIDAPGNVPWTGLAHGHQAEDDTATREAREARWAKIERAAKAAGQNIEA